MKKILVRLYVDDITIRQYPQPTSLTYTIVIDGISEKVGLRSDIERIKRSICKALDTVIERYIGEWS